jgi:hypothetical protein
VRPYFSVRSRLQASPGLKESRPLSNVSIAPRARSRRIALAHDANASLNDADNVSRFHFVTLAHDLASEALKRGRSCREVDVSAPFVGAGGEWPLGRTWRHTDRNGLQPSGVLSFGQIRIPW